MNVFVAGATGVLGRRAVAQLVAAGHDVTAVARSEGKAELVRELGATPVAVDLFDAAAVREAVAGHDAVVNATTKIPPLRRMAVPGAWDENDRVRTEVSRHLAAAAVAAGAQVFVQESIGFLYRDHSDEWIDEDTPIMETPHTPSLLAAEAAAAAVTEAGGRGVVLRFGLFMAPDSDQIELVVNAARVGLFMEPGRADTYRPIIHADDAAAAVVAALDAPAGAYHVVDDAPMTRGDHRAALGEAVGRRLVRPPAFLARLAGGRIQQLYRSQRPSNRRFKDATGWAPAYPDARATYRAIVRELRVPRRLPGIAWVALALLAFTGLSVGAQALVDPRGFFADFPAGREWVSADGPFNLHLLRDFAALNLGIGVLALVALLSRSKALTRAAGGVWLIYGVPHLVYHSLNVELEGFDAVANIVALAVVVAAAVAALAVPLETPVPIPRSRPAPRGSGAAPPAGNGGTSRRRRSPGRVASA